ncbi:GNAT family N-acetyltransferase [Sinomonas sp. ASV322]|uniref:GNAT family N-acetyltransferase n=1 Tax=Sinomonas sp. ASV322 TaxID=3041920 RepID=UPI0027DE0AE4|nr:GNAT family N-acetyltransferase [Sinomonas sp. ASV322]MDQ4502792.1 GNAT family N-acetyltransferase [Sinomonas sp. ASV322]
MAELNYRPWRAGDDQLLLQIWGDPEGPAAAQFRGELGPDAGKAGGEVSAKGDEVSETADDGDTWRRCVVAVDEGIPIAAGVVYASALHPRRVWAYVEVARDHRGRGVGTELLRRLREAALTAPGGPKGLRTKAAAGSAGEAFARASGLGTLERSRHVVVRPGSLKLPVFGDGSEQQSSQLVQDLATGSVELSDAVGRYYTAVHEWDPPAPLSVGKAQQLFLSDASGAHGAVVLRAPARSAFGSSVPAGRKGRLRAFAVSYANPAAGLLASGAAGHDDEPPTEVLLGHDPALEADDARDAVRGLLALVAYQHPVLLEVDDSMDALRAAVDPLLDAGLATQLGPDTFILGD